MGKITKEFQFSVDGMSVKTFKVGGCDSLPANVLAYAKKIDAVEGDIAEEKVESESEFESSNELLAKLKLSEELIQELQSDLEASKSEVSDLNDQLEKSKSEVAKLKKDLAAAKKAK